MKYISQKMMLICLVLLSSSNVGINGFIVGKQPLVRRKVFSNHVIFSTPETVAEEDCCQDLRQLKTPDFDEVCDTVGVTLTRFMVRCLLILCGYLTSTTVNYQLLYLLLKYLE